MQEEARQVGPHAFLVHQHDIADVRPQRLAERAGHIVTTRPGALRQAHQLPRLLVHRLLVHIGDIDPPELQADGIFQRRIQAPRPHLDDEHIAQRRRRDHHRRLLPEAVLDRADIDEIMQFISGGMLSTAELSILQARKEINLFAERIQRMFGMVRDLLHVKNESEFNKLFSRIEKYENISDNMELEIAKYLNQVSEGRLSSESKVQIMGMLREVTEIESIGDSCYNIARTINRKNRGNDDFTGAQYDHIHQMMNLTDQALSQMIKLVEDTHHTVDVNCSFNLENEINNYRNRLKGQNVVDVNNKEYDYQMGVHYMDIIAECEKLGDYVVNVVEAHTDIKEKKA